MRTIIIRVRLKTDIKNIIFLNQCKTYFFNLNKNRSFNQLMMLIITFLQNESQRRILRSYQLSTNSLKWNNLSKFQMLMTILRHHRLTNTHLFFQMSLSHPFMSFEIQHCLPKKRIGKKMLHFKKFKVHQLNLSFQVRLKTLMMFANKKMTLKK